MNTSKRNILLILIVMLFLPVLFALPGLWPGDPGYDEWQLSLPQHDDLMDMERLSLERKLHITGPTPALTKEQCKRRFVFHDGPILDIDGTIEGRGVFKHIVLPSEDRDDL